MMTNDAERRMRRWTRVVDPAVLIVGGIALFFMLLGSLFVWSLQGAREYNRCTDEHARTYVEKGYPLAEAHFLGSFHC